MRAIRFEINRLTAEKRFPFFHIALAGNIFLQVRSTNPTKTLSLTGFTNTGHDSGLEMEPLSMELDACRITHAASAACAQRIASAFSRRFYRSHHSDELDKYDDVARFFLTKAGEKIPSKRKRNC